MELNKSAPGRKSFGGTKAANGNGPRFGRQALWRRRGQKPCPAHFSSRQGSPAVLLNEHGHAEGTTGLALALFAVAGDQAYRLRRQNV